MTSPHVTIEFSFWTQGGKACWVWCKKRHLRWNEKKKLYHIKPEFQSDDAEEDDADADDEREGDDDVDDDDD